jgi:hypothetical protein
VDRSITENYRGSIISATPSIPGKYDRWNSWVDGRCGATARTSFARAGCAGGDDLQWQRAADITKKYHGVGK